MILLIGCGQQQEEIIKKTIKGTDGLVVEFKDDQPYDDKANEDTTFTMAIDIQNKGGFDIKDSIAIITVNEQVLNIESFDQKASSITTIESLKGIKTRTEGEKTTLFIDLISEKIITTQPTDVTVKTCYEYETEYKDKEKEQTCIDGTIHGVTVIGSICTYNPERTISKGQGAPIAITKIETTLPKDANDLITPTFKIHIKNEGKGKITQTGTAKAACTTGVNTEEYGIIQVEATLKGEKLNCEEIKYNEKKGEDNIITCTAEAIGVSINTEKALYIKLSYAYNEEVSKTIEIVK